jgi:hypothetical protein
METVTTAAATADMKRASPEVRDAKYGFGVGIVRVGGSRFALLCQIAIDKHMENLL